MENSNQRKTPLFAEVSVRNEDTRANKNKHAGGSRLPYFKLTYPNGVSLSSPARCWARIITKWLANILKHIGGAKSGDLHRLLLKERDRIVQRIKEK